MDLNQAIRELIQDGQTRTLPLHPRLPNNLTVLTPALLKLIPGEQPSLRAWGRAWMRWERRRHYERR